MTDRYDDIINHPRWEPANHPRMPLQARASQFAPFAALSGHDEAISETARITEAVPVADAVAAQILDERVGQLISNLEKHPEIEVTYFVRDIHKPGGSYTTHKGTVRLLDETQRLMIFTDGTRIPLSSLTSISGEIFSEIDSGE